MSKFFRIRWLGTFLAVLGLASWTWADTMELVTFYPTNSNTGDINTNSLVVGNMGNAIPPAGTLLVEDKIGVGTNSPQGSLHVVGLDNGSDSILFLPGQNGTINLGVGTETPEFNLDIQPSGDFVARFGNGDDGNALTIDVAGGQGLVSLVAGAKVKPTSPSKFEFLGTRGASRIVLHDGAIQFHTSDSKTGVAGADAVGLGFADAKMVLTNDGKLGIGTNDTPTAPLHIDGENSFIRLVDSVAANGDNALSNVHIMAANGALRIRSDNTTAIFIDDDNNTTNASFIVAHNATYWKPGLEYLFVVHENKNVSIGPQSTPLATAPAVPNGQAHNLDVNDVFLRSTGKWASQSLGSGPSSFQTNGYATLPGGLIMQWGTSGAQNWNLQTHTFPIPFPNACLQVVATEGALNLGGTRNLRVGNFTKTTFQSKSGPWERPFHWIAIGH